MILVVILIIPFILIWIVSFKFFGGLATPSPSSKSQEEAIKNLKEQWQEGRKSIKEATGLLKEQSQSVQEEMKVILEKEGETNKNSDSKEEAIPKEEVPTEEQLKP
jgi:predicted RNase H-like HicB family nuclease